MERHCENALELARWLEKEPKVRKVSYPGLTSHPQHELAKRQMGERFGGMVTMILDTDLAGTRRFLENTHLFSLAESLGGVESLVNYPPIMTHGAIPEEQRIALGITESLVRLSVGVEDVEDLRDDLRNRARGDLTHSHIAVCSRRAASDGDGPRNRKSSSCATARAAHSHDVRSLSALRQDRDDNAWRPRVVIVSIGALSCAAMGSSFGQLFRITTFGESHGGGVGVVIDGCPPRISLSEADIQRELDRRRPGQSAIVTPRQEADRCEILSGVFEGQTFGTPIAILVRNEDARPEAYREMKETPFAPRTPTSPTRRNTASATGRAAAAPRRARRSAASRPARSRARSWRTLHPALEIVHT